MTVFVGPRSAAAVYSEMSGLPVVLGAGLCVIYERAGGRVLRAVRCEAGYEADQVLDPATEDYLVVAALPADTGTVRVVDGVLVTIETEQR